MTVSCFQHPSSKSSTRSRSIRRRATKAQQTGASALKQVQIKYDCEEIDSDEISELLLEIGTLSVSCEVTSMKEGFLHEESNWHDLQSRKSWQGALLRANFPKTYDENVLIEMVKCSFPGVKMEISVEEVENKDWIDHVQSTWKPQVIGDLTVRFPWHEAELVNTPRELILEGGAAFGTGDHPTTRLCCRWLQKRIAARAGNDDNDIDANTNTRVLDYGCGSAILGLAALKYGATHADGVDIDQDALLSARNNCDMNALCMNLYMTIDEDTPEAWPTTPSGAVPECPFKDVSELEGNCYDLTIANILAPTLIFLRDELATKTREGGYIGLSGIVTQQGQAVIDCYKEYFDDMKIEEDEEDWVLLTGRRNQKGVL